MNPNAAQGFSQIVEDIGVLEYLISEYSDAAQDIPRITADWQLIRKPRVERIKSWAKVNSDMFISQPSSGDPRVTTWEFRSIKDVEPDMNAKFQSRKFLKWAQSYDAIGEVSNCAQGKVAFADGCVGEKIPSGSKVHALRWTAFAAVSCSTFTG